MTAEEMVLTFWGFDSNTTPADLSKTMQDDLRVAVKLMHLWEEYKMKKVKADAAAYEIALKQQENNEYYTRSAWDRTSQERDELKDQVKALEAIKAGLERSYKEATDKLKDYEALSQHNKALIADLNAQRQQIRELKEVLKAVIKDGMFEELDWRTKENIRQELQLETS